MMSIYISWDCNQIWLHYKGQQQLIVSCAPAAKSALYHFRLISLHIFHKKSRETMLTWEVYFLVLHVHWLP